VIKKKLKCHKSIMSLIEVKNLKVTIFSGKQEDWKFWEVKFPVRARLKGSREILLGTVKIPMDLEKFDLNKPDEKALSKIHEKNELTSKGDRRVVFQLVCCCKAMITRMGTQQMHGSI